jgi:DNA-binding NtrC family response regulator
MRSTLAFPDRAPELPRSLVIAGDSAGVRGLRDAISAVGPLPTHLLIAGESGTGRRTIARLLHDSAERPERPFIAIRTAGLPPTEVAARLFGSGGALTLAAQARDATVYVEAIDGLAPALQERLADVLRQQDVGHTRVIASTSRVLEHEVRVGRFSRALFDHVGTVQLSVPPLRAREEDIRAIANDIVTQWNERHDTLPRHLVATAFPVLEEHLWPGNVRELIQVLELACAQTRVRMVTPELLRRVLGRRPRRTAGIDITPLREVGREYLYAALARCDGNHSLAAARLGISRGTLARRLRECEPSVVERHSATG